MKVSLSNNESTCQFIVNGWGGNELICTDDNCIGFQPTAATFIIEAEPVHCFTVKGAGLGHTTQQVSYLCKKHAAIVATQVMGQKVGQRELKALAS